MHRCLTCALIEYAQLFQYNQGSAYKCQFPWEPHSLILFSAICCCSLQRLMNIIRLDLRAKFIFILIGGARDLLAVRAGVYV